MASITCKFGGSSLADTAAIQRAVDIINANPDRRFIVPSAPGKRNPEDKKVTDLLYAWHTIASEGFDPKEPRGIVQARFEELAQSLGVELDVAFYINEIDEQLKVDSSPDFMASRGEYLNGRLIAALLDATFVDPADYIKFNETGDFLESSYEGLANALQGEGRFVIPGFYGSDANGNIKTFSRGGSDVTGSIVARASGSELYENWTDVSGFMMADPRIVDNPRHISEITYQELRELAYMGATVLHDEAIFPVRSKGIPINIRNTNESDHPGTRIVASRESDTPVCGVAGRDGFSMLNIEKAFLNKERGFGRRVLSVLEENGVGWEHMPTGIDTISVILRDEDLDGLGNKIVEAIQKRCEPDEISITHGMAMIATVGQGMNHHVGVAARLCNAIAEANVNLRVIDQGSSEMNIIIGVAEDDLGKAVAAIYNAFENWS